MNKQESLKKLGEIISVEYVKHYKTKLDFSGACDVDEKTIRRILKGEQNLSMGIFLKICDGINIKPSDMLKQIGL